MQAAGGSSPEVGGGPVEYQLVYEDCTQLDHPATTEDIHGGLQRVRRRNAT